MMVLATARRKDRLEALAAELPAGRVEIMPGDLTSPDFRAQLWERAAALPGGLDLLVNNAGIGNYAEFPDQDPDAIRQIVELNVMALFDLTQKATRYMRARGTGTILQISSVLGFVGIPYSAAYVASKHAVNGLVKSLRYELRGTGVQVWAACPARTESEFSQAALGEGGVAGRLPRGEPTDRIVRAIVRRLDRPPAFFMPSWVAWGIVTAAAWLPGPFDWFFSRWVTPGIRNRLSQAGGNLSAPR